MNISAEVTGAYDDLRSDAMPTTWFISGFEEGKLDQLILISHGSGDWNEFISNFHPGKPAYGLFRYSISNDSLVY